MLRLGEGMTGHQLWILAEIHAVIARIEGMKADNAAWALQEGQAPAHSIESFEEMACQLERLGQEALKS